MCGSEHTSPTYPYCGGPFLVRMEPDFSLFKVDNNTLREALNFYLTPDLGWEGRMRNSVLPLPE